MTFFAGTGGIDIADATSGTVIGFTGGTAAELQDNIGDVFFGNGGADTIVAGSGGDILRGDGGADTLVGGFGSDTFTVLLPSDLAVGEVIDGTAETATLDTLQLVSAATYDLSVFSIANIDAINVSGNAAGYHLTVSDALVSTSDGNKDGTAGDLQIVSNLNTFGVTIDASLLTSTNSIYVYAHGLNGSDNIIGGNGSDTLDFSFSNVAIVVDLTAGVVTGHGTDTITSIENIVGGSANDVFHANVVDNKSNTFHGGPANGGGIDLLDYSSSISSLIINLAAGSATGNGIGSDTFAAIENVSAGSGSDTITGSTTANVINGGQGDDSITGGGGADTLDGGDDNDSFVVALGDAPGGEHWRRVRHRSDHHQQFDRHN